MRLILQTSYRALCSWLIFYAFHLMILCISSEIAGFVFDTSPLWRGKPSSWYFVDFKRRRWSVSWWWAIQKQCTLQFFALISITCIFSATRL